MASPYRVATGNVVYQPSGYQTVAYAQDPRLLAASAPTAQEKGAGVEEDLDSEAEVEGNDEETEGNAEHLTDADKYYIFEIKPNIYNYFVTTLADPKYQGRSPHSLLAFVLVVCAFLMQVYVVNEVLPKLNDDQDRENLQGMSAEGDVIGYETYRSDEQYDLQKHPIDPWLKLLACDAYDMSLPNTVVNDDVDFWTAKDGFGIWYGFTLRFLAVFYWGMYVYAEVRDCMFFGRLSVPKDGKLEKTTTTYTRTLDHTTTVVTWNVATDDKIVDVTLTTTNRVFVFILACMRMYVAVFVGLAGANFLFLTRDFKDIILNTVALTFLYDIDDCFFTAFVPVPNQSSLAKWTSIYPKNFWPLSLVKKNHKEEIEVIKGFCTLVAVIGVTVAMTIANNVTQERGLLIGGKNLDLFCYICPHKDVCTDVKIEENFASGDNWPPAQWLQ